MIRLTNGVELPSIGLGTFKARGADVQQAVTVALRHGIRHIDTASIYKAGATGLYCRWQHARLLLLL